jgi:PAS domain S-box-containing protein
MRTIKNLIKTVFLGRNICALCDNLDYFLEILVIYLIECEKRNERCLIITKSNIITKVKQWLQKTPSGHRLLKRDQIELYNKKKYPRRSTSNKKNLTDIIMEKKKDTLKKGFSDLSIVATHYIKSDSPGWQQCLNDVASFNHFSKKNNIHYLSIFFCIELPFFKMIKLTHNYLFTLVKEQNEWLAIENTRLTKNLEPENSDLRIPYDDEQAAYYKKIYEKLDGMVFISDLQGKFVDGNKQVEEVLGYSHEELLGLHINDIFRPDYPGFYEMINKKLTLQKNVIEKTACISKKCRIIPVKLLSFKVQQNGQEHIFTLCKDLSGQLKIKNLLKNYKAKLVKQRVKIKKMEDALKVVVNLLPKEERRLKRQIQIAIEQLLLPLLEKMKVNNVQDEAFVQLFENTIRQFTTVYGGGEMSDKLLQLTHKELEICNMVRQGFSTKEIAGRFNLSPSTIENHRNNIRKKLGIIKQNTNLSTFLKNAIIDA